MIRFLLLFISISSMAQDFEIQGHRGCRGLLPENTIPAFIRAIDEGVTTLELDVVISKDKKVVVSHDPYFEPSISTLANGQKVTKETQGNLYELTYKQIKKVDVGLRGNPRFPEQHKMAVYKPKLKKMIKKAEKYAKSKGVSPLKYNIELKSLKEEYGKSQPHVAEFSELVHKQISKYLPSERVCIQSFDFAILQYWNTKIKSGEYANYELSALIEPEHNNDIAYNLDLLGFVPTVWSPYFETLTKEKIEILHKKGIKVIPWTVNELNDMQEMVDLGCNGLITDYPNRTKSLKY